MGDFKSRNMMRGHGSFCRFAILLLLILDARRSQAVGLFAGARAGTSFGTGPQRFYQSEAFIGFKLLRNWDFYSDWHLEPGADASAGWINDGHVNGFIGAAGPFFEMGKGKFPVTMELGFSPTVLSSYKFDAKDFGGDLQFTSYAGLNWNLSETFTVGARIQHMSNGGFARPNPGVNFWMLSVRYNF